MKLSHYVLEWEKHLHSKYIDVSMTDPTSNPPRVTGRIRVQARPGRPLTVSPYACEREATQTADDNSSRFESSFEREKKEKRMYVIT